jgi:hypothetical protein
MYKKFHRAGPFGSPAIVALVMGIEVNELVAKF